MEKGVLQSRHVEIHLTETITKKNIMLGKKSIKKCFQTSHLINKIIYIMYVENELTFTNNN